MKKRMMILLTLTVSLAAVQTLWAGETEQAPQPEIGAGIGSSLYGDLMSTLPRVVTTSGDFGYWKNGDGTITIAEYNGEENIDLEIPAEIDGYTVSSIGPNAFHYKELTGISFPEGLESIDQKAFEYSVITNVFELPENIIIGEDAFSYAELASALTIPAGATVGSEAFSYCDTLQSVIIEPNAVLQPKAFNYCDNLVLVVCAPGSVLEARAFYDCEKFGQAVLCGDVDAEEDVFYGCDNLEMIEAEEGEFDTWKQVEPEPLPTGAMSGGWQIFEDSFAPMEAARAYHHAMKDRDEEWEMIDLLATQVVAGTNYCFLCRAMDDESSYKLVYVYEDLTGNSEVIEVQDIPIGIG